METCIRCRERWFAMDLKEDVCHACYLRDQKDRKTPFLMSTENEMDPGEVPADLPELTQIEEMVIARCHVQMMVHRYRGHQYHYTGHCVSFMQSTVRTVEVLPNLPSELDVVVLRPSNSSGDVRYQRQFQADFRVRRGAVLAWLYFLQANHPDYREITISADRLNALPVDADVSSSFPAVIDDSVQAEAPYDPGSVIDEAEPAQPNTQSMVPNLDIVQTEADLILQGITGRPAPNLGVPAPSIRLTPIDEAAGKDRIFVMAFPTLYPTGRADYNAPRLRNVELDNYAQHLIRFHDGRFGRHPRWRYLAFNMIMRRKANRSARFFVSKASRLKEMNKEELTDALNADEGLLAHIVRQGSALNGTRPFWQNKSNTLQAQVCSGYNLPPLSWCTDVFHRPVSSLLAPLQSL